MLEGLTGLGVLGPGGQEGRQSLRRQGQSAIPSMWSQVRQDMPQQGEVGQSGGKGQGQEQLATEKAGPASGPTV